jgi:hypothetical protein
MKGFVREAARGHKLVVIAVEPANALQVESIIAVLRKKYACHYHAGLPCLKNDFAGNHQRLKEPELKLWALDILEENGDVKNPPPEIFCMSTGEGETVGPSTSPVQYVGNSVFHS